MGVPSSSTTARADARIDPGHPFAAHLRRAAAGRSARPHAAWTPAHGALPALYLSHGAPMLFEMTGWMTELHDWARRLPRPRGVVVVSAHWESAGTMISAPRASDLVYDFGGFAPMYSRMRYDTPDATALARSVTALLGVEEPVHEHPSRGLDHGAWVPLKIMYPEADVPVVQVSMPTHDPGRLLRLGRRLRELRGQGVLVVGSGYLTHGLPFLDWSRPDVVPGWSADFDAWADEALGRGDVDELAAFRDRAPGMPYAHPTVEHFTPLFVTLGAADDPTAPPVTAVEGFELGLSKRSFEVV